MWFAADLTENLWFTISVRSYEVLRMARQGYLEVGDGYTVATFSLLTSAGLELEARQLGREFHQQIQRLLNTARGL